MSLLMDTSIVSTYLLIIRAVLTALENYKEYYHTSNIYEVVINHLQKANIKRKSTVFLFLYALSNAPNHFDTRMDIRKELEKAGLDTFLVEISSVDYDEAPELFDYIENYRSEKDEDEKLYENKYSHVPDSIFTSNLEAVFYSDHFNFRCIMKLRNLQNHMIFLLILEDF